MAAAWTCACASRLVLKALEPPARPLAGERFRRGTIQATLTLETSDGTRGLRIDAVALGQRGQDRKGNRRRNRTGAGPHRRASGAQGRDRAGRHAARLIRRRRGARDAAILESLAHAFDALARARANEGAKLANVLTNLLDEIERLGQ